MLNTTHPITRIPLTIAAIICIAPFFLIVEGSAWMKRRLRKHSIVSENVFAGLTEEDFYLIREHPLAKKMRRKTGAAPCFRCTVNGLEKQCPWCANRDMMS